MRDRGTAESTGMELSALDYYVLDSMMDLIQSVETIVGMLNHPERGWTEGGAPFTSVQVEDSLMRLVSAGLLERYLPAEMEKGSLIPHGDVDRKTILHDYFGLTSNGRKTCEDWQRRLDAIS